VSSAASVPGDANVRLFCALQLPDETVERLVAWQRELPPGAFRPVPRENLHVTLVFVGSRPAADVPDVCGALRDAAAVARQPVFRVACYRETRSVGMLVLDDEGGRGAALAADLAERLEALGMVEREARPWLAHVTLVRFRAQPRLSAALPGLGEVKSVRAAVYRSVLRSEGAQYEVLQSVALGG
jgi:RNA 2',3'-cyclic 3'-phosphodiesterase